MGNFYTDTILKDARSKITGRVNDLAMLEPITKTAVQNIIVEAKELGANFMVFETFRSRQRQEELFNRGKSKLRTVGVHHYGLACDIVKNIDGQPSWSGSFDLLGKLARKHRLIWGGDWGNPSRRPSFVDSCHVQRCTVGRQKELFAGSWYPGGNYNPYDDSHNVMDDMIPEDALSMPQTGLNKVNLASHANYSGERLEKLRVALDRIETVLNCETFKKQVLDFTYKGEKTFFYRRSLFGHYIDKPHTNEQVYNMIMRAEEHTGNINLNTIDLYLELINGADGSVIGYGNPGAKEIYTYSLMFDQMDIEDLTNHYVHEWCHKLGFDHASLPSGKRNKSVPYAIGNIVEELADMTEACMH